MTSLEGKSALVTGAGRGIGEATARKLASCGARVLVNDLDGEEAEAVAASIPGAVAFQADYGRWLRQNAGPESPTRKVVNISSTMGVHGGATQLAYSAGKAAVVGITKTLAKEWGRFNVTVNAVAFGAIETRLTSPYDTEPNISVVKGQPRKVGLSHEQIAMAKQASPLGRMGTPEDAANSIYLMCAPESDWITGEVILASGGVRS